MNTHPPDPGRGFHTQVSIIKIPLSYNLTFSSNGPKRSVDLSEQQDYRESAIFKFSTELRPEPMSFVIL